MFFNINNLVRIKLTDEGRAIAAREDRYFRSPDEDGWTSEQLWVVMQVFGPHLFNGGPLMFETEIEIPEKE